MQNNTAINAEFAARTRIEGKIRDLAKGLSTLAPNPKYPSRHGPAFISLNAAFLPAASYDGMLGSVIAESFLGQAFAQAAINDNGPVGGIVAALGSSAAQAAMQWIEESGEEAARKDEGDAHNNFGRGRGTVALMERRKVLTPDFNEEGAAWAAWRRDLREREQTEGHIAALLRELDAEFGGEIDGEFTAPLTAPVTAPQRQPLSQPLSQPAI